MDGNPEKLGGYRIDAELGRGGMGVVYRATHVETGQTVAIKVLPAQLARESGFGERFAREITALQKLSHQNIVRLIEPGEDQGYQYYVMEFVDGSSLDKIIARERRLPWARAAEIGQQICLGLKHAHDHGVIHRDLKPANLLVTADGTVKLTDFGISRVFEGTALTATGGILGTPEYMSPEQGDGRPVTRRADLYSLGAVLYTMLVGRPPFAGRSVAGLINLHRYGQFDRPMAVVPEIPSWLDELVCQLLEKEPDKRPPDARVVGRRLEAVQKKVAMRSAQTIVEGQATLQEQPRRKRREGAGPSTLMQRLMRAQLKELDDPGWLGRQFQKTWVLAVALVIAVGTLIAFTLMTRAGGEKRAWNEIDNLRQSAEDQDLASVRERLNDYIRNYPEGAHAAEAKDLLPDAERDFRRREFLRSAAVKDLRPGPEPISDLERLYRKSLLQQWLEGDAAARTTLEEILSKADVREHDKFLLRLAEEDYMSLEIRRAEQLHAEGHTDQAIELLHGIIEKRSSSLRYRRWIRAAEHVLAKLQRADAAEKP
jgi:predicted Ser/Thr protein kinase